MRLTDRHENVTEIDVSRALDGDRDALTRLVERVSSPGSRLALRFFGNPADASRKFVSLARGAHR